MRYLKLVHMAYQYFDNLLILFNLDGSRRGLPKATGTSCVEEWRSRTHNVLVNLECLGGSLDLQIRPFFSIEEAGLLLAAKCVLLLQAATYCIRIGGFASAGGSLRFLLFTLTAEGRSLGRRVGCSRGF